MFYSYLLYGSRGVVCQAIGLKTIKASALGTATVTATRLGWATSQDTALSTLLRPLDSIQPTIRAHTMQSIRTSLLRRALQLSAAPRSIAAHRPLSSTSQLRSAESHGDHYNPPGGWLFGVKHGEKYENEGWEKVFYWGFFGSMAFGVIGYCYKPDTRCAACPSDNPY